MIRKENNLETDDMLQPDQLLVFTKYSFNPYVGPASWYGPGFDGKKMANGEIYNQNDVLIAHRHLPLGIMVKITRIDTGKSIVVPVLDRGPYPVDEYGNFTREVDLSKGAAKLLGAIKPGVISVKIEPVEL